MDTLHPKGVRRRILLVCYEHFHLDPMDMLTPEDFIQDHGFTQKELLANAFYLHDRGMVELSIGFNPPLFAGARITAAGIDLIENPVAFDRLFPAHPEGLEKEFHDIPALLERLIIEAECAPLDGDDRRTLIRDVEFLRDEVARPAIHWRTEVVEALIAWIKSGGEGVAGENLPALEQIEARIKQGLKHPRTENEE